VNSKSSHSSPHLWQRPGSPKHIVRLVVGAVLAFTVAIALPFMIPAALFRSSLFTSETLAPVIVDGRAVFRVANTATTASAAARADTISRSLQQFAQQQQIPKIEVEVTDPDSLATVQLGYPDLANPQTLFNFTVTSSDTTSSLTPATQAEDWAEDLRQTLARSRAQRQTSYIRQNLWQVPVAAIVAALAHWLSGLLWRGYLYRILQSVAADSEAASGQSKTGQSKTGQSKTGQSKNSFTTVNLFLNTTLLLLRAGIWIGALLYATNLFPVTRQISYRIISQLTGSFTAKTLPFGNNPISILDIFRVLALVLLVTLAAQIISNMLKRRVLQETGINRGVQEAIAILLRYSLIFVGCIVVLQASGINLSSLTLLASALGVGAGLGLQNIVKDIGSGLVLVFERPVQVGEFIQFGDQTGTVERIGARSSEIRTLDQISIIVPNSQFLENEVINWSHRNPISRIRIPIGVSYKSDPEQVRELLLCVGRQHLDVLVAPPPQVLFCSFGESALEFELLVWVAQPSRQFIIKSDLLFMLAEALREQEIEIPFPQRDIRLLWSDLPDSMAAQQPSQQPS
jgi:potassium-dependent mechanosensitive channel